MVIFCIKYFNCISNRSLSAATTPLIQQRALEGTPAAQRSRGSRVVEPLPPTPQPPPAWYVHALFSSPGG